MEKRKSKLNPIILEEATSWFIDFNQGDVNDDAREDFNAWLRRSPEHVRAYLQVSSFWEDSSILELGDVNIDALIARAKAEANIYPLDPAPREAPPAGGPGALEQRPRQRAKRIWLATAAAIILGIAATIGYTLYRAPTYATEIGEQRSITLDDGSSVQLNARSRLVVKFGGHQRTVDLIEGQALFRVAKDPIRPFIVTTGDTSVRAVGTEFDVYRRPTSTVVTVIEGKVAVLPKGPASGPSMLSGQFPARRMQEKVLVAAGEQLIVSPLEAALPKAANIAIAMAWTQQRLIFEETPLRDVVEEFNRYNRQQLVIREPELYGFHVSGVFLSTDSDRLVEFLRQRFGITMSRDGDEIEISRRVHKTKATIP